MKPYQTLAIAQTHDPLIPIPRDRFAFVDPHPYQAVGAPYGDKSPFYLRQRVVDKLIAAQATLQQQRPHWRIQIFDAYRPLAVQSHMVEHTFQTLLRDRHLLEADLTPTHRDQLMALVYQFWAVPNSNPNTPPPHSTGAAIDITLVNETGQVIDMGSPIDELSDRSFPQYFADSTHPLEQQFHHHRELLRHIMVTVGFKQHMNEWWHFSWGDQLWAWLTNQDHPPTGAIAHYGRID